MDEKKRPLAVFGVVTLLLYLGAYGVLRQQHVLVRTGRLHNSYVGGVLAPDAGWADCEVRLPAGRGGGWLEVLFWPQTFTESLFWNTVGRRCRVPK